MSTVTGKNEAAERLRTYLGVRGERMLPVFDEALAAERLLERQATVVRIRAAARKRAVYWQGLDAILDEEAAR